MIAWLHEGDHSGGMDGPALAFMALSWLLVISLNVYCFAKVLRDRR